MPVEKLITEVIPFRGLRYDTKKVEIAKAIAPPYDVISSGEREQYRAYPYNICHLILPGADYEGAARIFDEWQKKKILIQDDAPSFYLYAQEYMDNGVKKKRLGCMGSLRLQETEGSSVLPHEQTLSKPKEDRFTLLRTVQANLSPIFGIIEDQDRLFVKTIKEYTDQHPAPVGIEIAGVRHEFWQVSDPSVVRSLQDALVGEKILIADGHHRYESALAYRSERRRQAGKTDPDAPYEFVLMHFVSAKDQGLTIWPFHRVLQGGRTSQKEGIIRELNGYFEIKNVSSHQLLAQLAEQKGKRPAFGLYLKGRKSYLLTLQHNSAANALLSELPPPMRQLDVSILHTIVLKQILDHPVDEEHIYFTPDAQKAIDQVERNGYEMTFLLNPTPIEQIYSIAGASTRLPQKSTYFYPKLLSGLVINKLS
ncbi:MAG: DUF1015 domain-containing protein [Candidatus Omnitrophica bacterium]|nr:DUF1015 domain-containing protein [Candidatus Omnitrophota bacterium]